MTGYLQRMAERALRPERAIRPILGSIFAPTGRAAASETSALEEDVLSSAVSPPAPLRQPSLDAQSPPPLRRPSLDAQSPPPLRSALSDDRAATPNEPLVAPVADPAGEIEPLATARREPSTSLPAPRSAAQGTDESGDRQMRPTAETTPSPRQMPSLVDNVETLLPAQPVDALVRLPRPADPRPQPSAAFGAANSRGPLRDGHPIAPDGDDIQIHIGRIEVTAVRPTPAPQPAAKNRRGAPSLDDYIRRRDGRAP
jgi:hypothetical protein